MGQHRCREDKIVHQHYDRFQHVAPRDGIDTEGQPGMLMEMGSCREGSLKRANAAMKGCADCPRTQQRNKLWNAELLFEIRKTFAPLQSGNRRFLQKQMEFMQI